MAIHSIICKSCGANEFSEENGLYVCKICGTKHILSDDGNTFNVYVDGMPLTMKEQYDAARCAYASGDYQQALQLYKTLNRNYPMHWEPIFFIKIIYFLDFTPNTDFQAQCKSFMESLPALFELIKNNYDIVGRHTAMLSLCSEFKLFCSKMNDVFSSRDLRLSGLKADALTSKEEIAVEIQKQCSRRLEILLLANEFRNYIIAHFLQDREIWSIAYKLIQYIVDVYAAYYGDFRKIRPETEDLFWQSFELLGERDKELMFRRYGIRDINPQAKPTPKEVKVSAKFNLSTILKVLAGVFVVVLLFKGCFGFESKVTETANPLTKEILGTSSEQQKKISVPKEIELLTREGSPRLFSDWKENKDFYKYDSDDLVLLPTNYSGYKKHVLVLHFSKKYQLGDDYIKLIDIQIYPRNFASGTPMNLKAALKLVDHFMPWDIMDKYYQEEPEGPMHYTSAKDEDEYYIIRYSLLPKYRFDSSKKLSYSANIIIKTDKSQKVNLVQLVDGYHDPMGRQSSYKGMSWQPENFHKLPPPPQTPDIMKFAQAHPLPKLLGKHEDLIKFCEALGVEYCYLEDKNSRDKLGDKNDQNLLRGAGAKQGHSENRYVFDMSFYFDKTPGSKHTLQQAIEFCDKLLPKEIINKHYNLLYSRKKTRKKVSKGNDDYASYQVVYKLNLTTANRDEVIKCDYPEYIRVFIGQDYNKYITKASVDCYRHTPEIVRDYEEATDAKGNLIEIYKGSREYGPYEQVPNSFYMVEYWQCPF